VCRLKPASEAHVSYTRRMRDYRPGQGNMQLPLPLQVAYNIYGAGCRSVYSESCANTVTCEGD
jgi:hypothetical protein